MTQPGLPCARALWLIALLALGLLIAARPSLRVEASPTRCQRGILEQAPSLNQQLLGSKLSSEASNAANFPFLDDEDETASVSVGGTSDGRIINARAVVESEQLAILPRQKARGLRYGSAELIELLQEVGSLTQLVHGSPLWLGNLSKKEGGDIPWSVSHNAGRDADLAFAYADRAGNPVDPPDLVPLDDTGRSKDGNLQLDLARTWTIVWALCTSSTARVQYLFISEPIKRMLLSYARKQGVSPALVARADLLLHQPSGALSHNDHIHVRILCSRRDAGAGCVDVADPDPDPELEGAREERRARARTLLRHPSQELRSRAALRLAVLGDASAVPAIFELLEATSSEVRTAATVSLATLGTEKNVEELADRLRREDDPQVAAVLLAAIARLGGIRAGEVIRDFLLPLATDRPPEPSGLLAPRQVQFRLDPFAFRKPDDAMPLQLAALEAARYVDQVAPLDALLSVLESRGAVEQQQAASAIAHITNVSPKSLQQLTPENINQDKILFQRLQRSLGTRFRDAWLVHGFRAAGYRVRSLDATDAWELVRASGESAAVSYNAQRTLARLLGMPATAIFHESPRTACTNLLRIVNSRRKRLRIGEMPRGLRASCNNQN